MSESPLRLIKRSAEFQPTDQVTLVPKGRGLYVLYRCRRIRGHNYYNVVYVGMSTKSIRRRLVSHARKKANLWTHFSVYEVWENIRDEEIVELEGLFRHLYRRDRRANALAVQKVFKKAVQVRRNNLEDWTVVQGP